MQLVFDLWTGVDLVSSAFNLFCFNYIGSVQYDSIIYPAKKEVLDYYVIAVTICTWIRLFSYFLVIRTISKLLHTLFRMIFDTLAFIFIFCCYMILVSTLFTTLFSIPEPEWFGTISISAKTLFDAFIGQYEYTENDNY